MDQYKLVKINTGRSIHLAEFFETISNVKGYDVFCGSGKTGLRNGLRSVGLKFSPEKITCKKCQKRYEELLKRELETTENWERVAKIKEEEMTLKQYKDSRTPFIINK